MKKVFLIILTVYLFSITCFAQTVVYVWENTTITLEVNSPLENYLNIPQLSVYVSNQKQDVEIIYSRDYTYATLNTVTTHIVGNYFLDYKAEIPYYGYTSKQRIYFNVVDTIAPVISVTDKTIGLNESIDVLKQITVTDNYSPPEKITLEYDKSVLNNKIVGTYRIKITATDECNNFTTAYLNITVADETAPVITAISSIVEIEYNTKNFKISDYYYAFDNNDSELTNRIIIIQDIDLLTLGKQKIILSVTDEAGNTTLFSGNVYIVDTTTPTITLKKYFMELSVSEEFTEEFFRDNIEKISDNETILDKESVSIDSATLRGERGQYEIIYSVKDNSGNEGNATLTIRLNYIEQIKAEFADIVVKKGEVFDYKDYITITKEINNNYYITVAGHNVDINKAGKYFIDIVIYDSYNNQLAGKISVEVLEEELVIESENDLSKYTAGTIIVIIIGLIVFLYIKKIRKKEKDMI